MTALPQLDDLDRRILQAMQSDSSLTNQELAKRVHASAPTCLRRVRRLTEEGVIEKQVAILAPEKVGAGLTAISEITLDVQSAEHMMPSKPMCCGNKPLCSATACPRDPILS